MKTLRKKKTFSLQETQLYKQVTEISKFYEVFFRTYCKGLFCPLKNSHHGDIPPYMHKTLPRLGNEKNNSKSNFTKNRQAN